MNDRAIALLEQYEIELHQTRKGRGAILCETNQGLLIFKEYFGNPEKLFLQDRILKQINAQGEFHVEGLFPNREGTFYVQDRDGVNYILKTYPEGRECNIHDKNECLEAVRALARLHKTMILPSSEEWEGVPYSPYQEYEKHNKEFVKVRNYLRQKSSKQDFEVLLSKILPLFMEQANEVTCAWKAYEEERANSKTDSEITICHGDFQYHNILYKDREWHIINFEKCIQDDQIRDFYLFLRKILEKSNWSIALGRDLIEAYGSIHPLSAYSYIDLYYRLAYPEKFWKIVNFYFNSSKAWIPEKYTEKLCKVLNQEPEKENFLREVFQTVIS